MEVFLKIGGTFISGAALFLVLEASKYLGPNFNLKIFYKTNIKPLKWSAVGSLILILVYSFLPGLMPFIETHTGEVNITSYEGIMLSGSIIGAIIKNIFRKK